MSLHQSASFSPISDIWKVKFFLEKLSKKGRIPKDVVFIGIESDEDFGISGKIKKQNEDINHDYYGLAHRHDFVGR